MMVPGRRIPPTWRAVFWWTLSNPESGRLTRPMERSLVEPREGPENKDNGDVAVDRHWWEFQGSRYFKKKMKNGDYVEHEFRKWVCGRCPARRTDIHDEHGVLLRRGPITIL